MYQFLIIAYLFTFHYDKTTCMAFKTRHKTRQTPNLDIRIENNMLRQVDKQKLLGDFIDEKLSWTAHIDYLCATISSKVSLLKQLLSYVPVEIHFFFFFFFFFFIKAIFSWETTSNRNIERLSKQLKRAARIILNVDCNTPSLEMFTKLGLPIISNRHSYSKAVLTYKALNKLTPEYISDFLKPVLETHNRNLRPVTYGTLSVSRSKTTLYDWFIFCFCTKTME